MIQKKNDTDVRCHRKTTIHYGHTLEIQKVIDLVDLGKDFPTGKEHLKGRKTFEKSIHNRQDNINKPS